MVFQQQIPCKIEGKVSIKGGWGYRAQGGGDALALQAERLTLRSYVYIAHG